MKDPLAGTKRKSIPTSAALTIGSRWTNRLVGFISMLILARLLVPSDFGLVAMAMIVVGLIDVILDLGVNMALIHKADADQHDFNTAWTLRLLQSALAALIVLLTAPLVADYYQDQRVCLILQVVALSVFLAGWENIGIVSFTKNMEFGREFQYQFIKRISGFVATMIFAWILRSYWALIIGTIVTQFFGVVYSYILHKFRPRFSFSRFRQIWSFSQWVLVRNIGAFMFQCLDRIIIGRIYTADTLGNYEMAGEIAKMPTTEILSPIGRVLFPAFVEVRHDSALLQRSYFLAMGIQLMMVLPAGLGLFIVAEEAVPVLLGSKWIAAIPLLQILALASAASTVNHSGMYLFLALGKIRLIALFSWIQILLFLGLVFGPLSNTQAEGFAVARLIVALIGLVCFQYIVFRTIRELRLVDLISYCWRPVSASLLMVAVEFIIPWQNTPSMVTLIAKIAIGTIVYTGSIMALWHLANRPEGPERWLLDKLEKTLKTIKTRKLMPKTTD